MSKMLKELEENKTTFTPGSIKNAAKLAGASSKDLWQIPVENIVVKAGLNPRVMNDNYKAHIRVICESIKNEGFLPAFPIGAFANAEGEIVVRSGFTRIAAVKLAIAEGAEITTLPVVISQAGVSESDVQAGFINDNLGRALTLYETGVVVQRLTKFGHEPEVLAKRFGYSTQHITNLLALMAAPMALKELVAMETVSASLAIDLLAKHGAEKALKMLENATDGADGTKKAKVTKKDLAVPGKAFTKCAKANATELYDAVQALLADAPNLFAKVKFSEGVYERFDAVVTEIEESDDRAAE